MYANPQARDMEQLIIGVDPLPNLVLSGLSEP